MSNALTPEQQRAMVAAYTITLPEPAFGFLVVSEETGQWIESRAGEAAFDADNLHAHAAAVSAAKDAEIAGLREDVERWRNGAEVWRESAEKFGAKCEQLQPVFDAACKYADAHRAMVAVCFDAEIGEGDILAEELNLSLAEAQLKLATDAARAALGDKTP